jgi:HEAT repeat protein
VRNAAEYALDELRWEPGNNEASASYWIAKRQWEKCAKLGVLAVLPLMTLLDDKDLQVRLKAVEVLGQIKDPLVVEVLSIALEDKDWQVRLRAVEVLGQTKDTLAEEALIKALEDIDGKVHRAVVLVLEQKGAVKPLIAALKKSYSSYVSEALIRIGKPAVGLLILALKDTVKTVRCAAAETLCMIDNVQAVEPPITSLEDIVEPPIDLLEDDYGKRRRASAENLVKLYRSGELDMRLKQRIFTFQEKMSEPHTDREYESYCETPGGHTDIGIGVDFPL